ncbi:MAG: TAXI family TRAP transporter solute-binding subunit [Deltaproteobacteria bacterium]|nr:TAXI family TRAP transporter solute-binding subunit [Deltaproteobacteria bacterium]
MSRKTMFSMTGVLILFALFCVVGVSTAQEKVKSPNLVFVSGSVGGTWHPIASAIVEKAHEHMVGRPISVRPGAGGQGNPEVVGRGIADFGISYGPFLILASRAEGPYKKKYTNLRAVTGLIINKEHFIADPKLGVSTIDEILEKKMKVTIGTGTPGSGDRFVMEQILAAHGLTFSETEAQGIKWELTGTTARVKAWKDRHIDVFNSFILVPSSAIQQVAHSRKGKFLGISAKTRKFLVDKWGLIDASIPANTYPGQPEAVPSIALPFMVFVRADIPEDVVYVLTKAAAENKEYLASAVAAMSAWNPENMWKGLGIELHPGAARYYKERGWIK